MKRHKDFNLNKVTIRCPICKSVVGYFIFGDNAKENMAGKNVMFQGVCPKCAEYLNNCDAFVSSEINKEDNSIQNTYDYFFYKHSKLSEIFSDTDDIHIINNIPRENFEKMFRNMLDDYRKEKEDGQENS